MTSPENLSTNTKVRYKATHTVMHKNNQHFCCCSWVRRSAWAAAAATVLFLQGCVLAPVVVGGAAIGTASVIADRRSTGTIVNDQVIESRVAHEITQALGSTDEHHVTVTSYEGKVLLTGEVKTESARTTAEQIASRSQDVAAVVNELAVMDPTSFSTRISDSMLATKVRSAIVGTDSIELNQMKVTVDRGIVYLMGVVTQKEAQRAARVAAGVSGVQMVVTVFNIESEEAVRARFSSMQSNTSSQGSNTP